MTDKISGPAPSFNYPADAAQVRDLIREMMRSQVDEGTSMDGGGGFGSADLWLTIGGREFFVNVKPTGRTPSPMVRETED